MNWVTLIAAITALITAIVTGTIAIIKAVKAGSVAKDAKDMSARTLVSIHNALTEPIPEKKEAS